MELTLVYTIIGFGLAGYSVIANDSIQTLGTFIASKQKWFKWYTLASAASLVMIFAITWGWYSYDGDISYGRLTRIPYQEIQWYHAVAPGILLILTRIGIPVSTTFLVLSAFATTIVLEKMLVKSIIGYGIAATVAYISWIVVSKFINEKSNCLGKYTAMFATSCDNQTHHNQPDDTQTELRQNAIHFSPLTSSNFSLINLDTTIQEM